MLQRETYPVGGGDLDDQVNGLRAEVPAVTADYESTAYDRRLYGAEHGLDEVLRVVGPLEDPDGLAQAASAGLLTVVRLCRDAHRLHNGWFGG